MDERTKRIWRGLANYANATAKSIDLNELQRTIADYMPWYLWAEWAAWGPGSRPDLVLEQAVEYQGSVRNLLNWFCRSNESFDPIALNFLREHVDHIKWRLISPHMPQVFLEQLEPYYSHDDLESFTEESERYSAGWQRRETPHGIQLPAKDYDDLADPICDFLLTEYQKYHAREYSRRDKKLPPLSPLFVCPRCGKLVMAERIGRRKYCPDCSDKARAKSYLKKASPDENKDYQWLYRLQKEDPGRRRARLRLPKAKQRLAEIIARQQNSTRCQKLIHDMRLHVAPTNG